MLARLLHSLHSLGPLVVLLSATTGACTDPAGKDTQADTGTDSASDTGADSDPTEGTGLGACGAELPAVALLGKPGEAAGDAVAGAGDVNGDGLPDVVVGAPGNIEPDFPGVPGRAYVLFSPLASESIDLVGSDGLVLVGEEPRHAVGSVVEGVGDVNGDGFADVLVGATGRCYFNEECDLDGESGDCYDPCSVTPYRAYLVHGRADAGEILLKDVAAGKGGFSISGDGDWSGDTQAYAPMGDLNKDGLADFAVATLEFGSGKVYVVFGRKDTTPVALEQLEATGGGYKIQAETSSDQLGGGAMRAAGDVNGDGLMDLILGASYFDSSGRGYVVFGKASTTTVKLSALAAGKGGGFALLGEGGMTGLAVAPAGDMNHDGFADVAISAPYLDVDGDFGAGRVYVVFGKADPAPVELGAFTAGARITGDGLLGYVLNGDGSDLNGDGEPDLIVGDGSNTLTLVSGATAGADISLDGPSTSLLQFSPGVVFKTVIGDLDCDGRSEVVAREGGWSVQTPGVTHIDLNFTP